MNKTPCWGIGDVDLEFLFQKFIKCNVKQFLKHLVECKKQKIKLVIPEIMIPLVSTAAEIKILRKLVEKTAEAGSKKTFNQNKILCWYND